MCSECGKQVRWIAQAVWARGWRGYFCNKCIVEWMNCKAVQQMGDVTIKTGSRPERSK